MANHGDAAVFDCDERTGHDDTISFVKRVDARIAVSGDTECVRVAMCVQASMCVHVNIGCAIYACAFEWLHMRGVDGAPNKGVHACMHRLLWLYRWDR